MIMSKNQEITAVPTSMKIIHLVCSLNSVRIFVIKLVSNSVQRWSNHSAMLSISGFREISLRRVRRTCLGISPFCPLSPLQTMLRRTWPRLYVTCQDGTPERKGRPRE